MMIEAGFMPGLRSGDMEKVALQSVSVEVSLNHLLCETRMTQVYQNRERKPIEAVYTFPLPGRAVLMDLKVVIGDREWRGIVAEKATAEEQYEDAIADGNAAILLEQAGPGIYTMNVGNILAGETVSISIHYAELLYWQGDTLRFLLPTTIAPRYGDPEQAGLQPHQVPETDILAENRFQLRLTIGAGLAEAAMDSPSHAIAVARSKQKTIVTLAAGQAFMDRDFILNIRADQAHKDAVVTGRDVNDGFVALASFAPRLPAGESAEGRNIKILVDCSGSMAGDSISQARQAVSDILDQLRPADYFNIFAFGDTCRAFFNQQAPANKENITRIRRMVRGIEADMGGTKIEQALQAVTGVPGPAINSDILLITDGETWDADDIIRMARQSGHRVFTVGVGSAVSESFVRRLAHETGGACELAGPNENIAEKIVRHFQRIYLPRADAITVRWPLHPQKMVPRVPGAVFDGDTLHVFAFFAKKPAGAVILEMTLADGRTLSQAAVLPEIELAGVSGDAPGTIARLAVHESLADETDTDAAALALTYQLISPWTHYIAVVERIDEEKEKGRELPVLRKTPQMLAAGWGGTGTVYAVKEQQAPMSEPLFQVKRLEDLRRISPPPPDFIKQCNRRHWNLFSSSLKIRTYEDLENCGLPWPILTLLESIAEQYNPGAPELLIVSAFLNTLASSKVGVFFNRSSLRVINRVFQSLTPDIRLIDLMDEAFVDIREDYWGMENTYYDRLFQSQNN